jgi:hypothetical protein
MFLPPRSSASVPRLYYYVYHSLYYPFFSGRLPYYTHTHTLTHTHTHSLSHTTGNEAEAQATRTSVTTQEANKASGITPDTASAPLAYPNWTGAWEETLRYFLFIYRTKF